MSSGEFVMPAPDARGHMDISDAWAVVFSSDGSRHKFCWTTEETLDAITEAAVDGDVPVVFTQKSGKPSVVNINHGGGSGIQAGTIHGGVRLG